MLQQCETHIRASMEAAGPHTTEEAVQWIDLADRLKFDKVKVMCAKRIATDLKFDRAQSKVFQLPANALQLVIVRTYSLTYVIPGKAFMN